MHTANEAVRILKEIRERLHHKLDTDTAEALDRAIQRLEYLSEGAAKKRDHWEATREAQDALAQILQSISSLAEFVSDLWK